jgi:hypothetical protein
MAVAAVLDFSGGAQIGPITQAVGIGPPHVSLHEEHNHLGG